MVKNTVSILLAICLCLTGCCWNEIKNKTETELLNFKIECETDWLIMIYADGDNSLYGEILSDINEAEYGLSLIRDEYGLSKAGKETVKVVVLWDGLVNTKYSGTYLLELGADSVLNTEFSCNTVNFSSSAQDWLSDSGEVSINGSGEVAMSSYNTLANFINWCNEHYNAKRKVLVLEDHGTGPGYLTYRNVYNTGRAICQDLSIGAMSLMSTGDVSTALRLSGLGTENRLDLLIEDVCYGASIEDVYELSDYTNYYIGSANQTPGNGHNYTKMMIDFADNDTALEAASGIVQDFYSSYKETNELVLNDMEYEWSEVPPYKYVNGNLIGGAGTPTIAVFDSLKLQDLIQKISSMSTLLINEGDSRDYISGTSYNEYLCNNFVKDDADLENVLFYTGNMNYLFDLGLMMTRFAYASSTEGATALGGEAWTELYEACIAVQEALAEVIKYSWRDGYSSQDSSTYGMYSIIDGIKTEDFTNHIFGMTICGGSRLSRTGLKNTVYSWYKTDLAFGRDTSWYELLVKWFSTIE